jgi:hypothetical protein
MSGMDKIHLEGPNQIASFLTPGDWHHIRQINHRAHTAMIGIPQDMTIPIDCSNPQPALQKIRALAAQGFKIIVRLHNGLFNPGLLQGCMPAISKIIDMDYPAFCQHKTNTYECINLTFNGANDQLREILYSHLFFLNEFGSKCNFLE